jgi:uncharacterized membrane protein YgdD (TMEM256/DUF423 family)
VPTGERQVAGLEGPDLGKQVAARHGGANAIGGARRTKQGRGRLERIWIGLASLVGLTAVGMAALAAHGLDALGPTRLQMVRNALQMQGWHALALLACGLWSGRGGGALANAAGLAFLAGVVVFCGSVYALAIAGTPVGGLAPVGGTLLMVGWVLLALSALRPRRP